MQDVGEVTPQAERGGAVPATVAAEPAVEDTQDPRETPGHSAKGYRTREDDRGPGSRRTCDDTVGAAPLYMARVYYGHTYATPEQSILKFYGALTGDKRNKRCCGLCGRLARLRATHPYPDLLRLPLNLQATYVRTSRTSRTSLYKIASSEGRQPPYYTARSSYVVQRTSLYKLVLYSCELVQLVQACTSSYSLYKLYKLVRLYKYRLVQRYRPVQRYCSTARSNAVAASRHCHCHRCCCYPALWSVVFFSPGRKCRLQEIGKPFSPPVERPCCEA